MTLLELMIASAIMTVMCGAMAGIAIALQQSANYNFNRGAPLQHARVTFERIQQKLASAYAAPTHPGAAVYVDMVGTNRYPDTLIVWCPGTTPVNADGPPLISECVFYCWDPTSPSTLIELTAPTDTRTIPFDSTLQTPAWRTTLNALKTASTSKKNTLTTLLRPCSVSSGSSIPSGMATTRGAVRFELVLAPSAAEYASYLAGTTAWTAMQWPQNLYGSQFGMRRIWLRMELQLMPSDRAGQQDTTGQFCIPFFSSALLQDQMTP
jgi:hypothetical protein